LKLCGNVLILIPQSFLDIVVLNVK